MDSIRDSFPGNQHTRPRIGSPKKEPILKRRFLASAPLHLPGREYIRRHFGARHSCCTYPIVPQSFVIDHGASSLFWLSVHASLFICLAGRWDYAYVRESRTRPFVHVAWSLLIQSALPMFPNDMALRVTACDASSPGSLIQPHRSLQVSSVADQKGT